MLRVVFDTVVFVRSLINPYSVCGRVVFQHFTKYRLFVSQPILLEIFEVLARPEITRKFRAIEALDKSRVIEIISEAEVVDLPGIPAVSRDVKDDKFLATAKAAAADYLVTEDADLLVLDEYEDAAIVNCVSFLHILEQQEENLP